MTVLDTNLHQETHWVTEDGDHDKEAHLVTPASAATEAMVSGVPCVALCGKRWVPTRDPDSFSVCKLCIETWEGIYGKPWPGRR